MTRPTALITGGTKGIGLAIAEELSRTHQIILGGRNRQRVELIATAFPGAIPFVADLSGPDEVRAAVEEVVAPLGELDVLVNNAGVASTAPLKSHSQEHWQSTFDVNVFGLAELTVALLPYLEAAEGIVVNINSGAGLSASKGFGAYSASKFALKAFTDTLRLEHPKIRVSSVHPGRVSTQMQRSLEVQGGTRYRRGPELNPDTVAKTVRFVVDVPPGACVEQVSIRPHA